MTIWKMFIGNPDAYQEERIKLVDLRNLRASNRKTDLWDLNKEALNFFMTHRPDA